jgi:DNA polymerase III subunit epsilon
MLKTLRRWLDARLPPDGGRWLVLDVESSGLDTRADRLLAIAAVAVHHADGSAPRIVPGDSFEVVLRQAGDSPGPADKANILLHHIGVGAQRQGVVSEDALLAFERFVGNSPLIAFHAAFDRAMIDRACDQYLGRRLPNAWLDLEPVAAVLHPAVRARALDDWLAHFGIGCAVRHQAAADTLATAELLLKLWPGVRRQVRTPGFAALVELAAQRRWVPAG